MRAARATTAGPEPARVPIAAKPDTAPRSALARGNAPPAVVSPPAQASATPPPASTPTARAVPVNTSNSNNFPMEGALGLLAALSVAAAGIFVMMRRRRDSDEELSDFAETYPHPEPGPAALADPMTLPANPPTRLGPSPEALVAGPVPIGEDRLELLEVMVAAAPNEANPFTSRKARMRRARLILQHREHLQMQGKPFDWRTYRPTTRSSAPTPSEPLVDA